MQKLMGEVLEGGLGLGGCRMDGVKRALNDRRMDMREACKRARNRNAWRMIMFLLSLCIVGYPPNRGKRSRYIDRYFSIFLTLISFKQILNYDLYRFYLYQYI